MSAPNTASLSYDWILPDEHEVVARDGTPFVAHIVEWYAKSTHSDITIFAFSKDFERCVMWSLKYDRGKIPGWVPIPGPVELDALVRTSRFKEGL